MTWIVDINIPDNHSFYIGQVQVEAASKEEAMAAAKCRTGCTPAGAYTLRPIPEVTPYEAPQHSESFWTSNAYEKWDY